MEQLRRRRAYYRSAQCNYWVFEEAGSPGAFLEFVEAPSAEVLRTALASAPDGGGDGGPIFLETELE
ncbi:MAG: hypothetical protein WKG32_08785 [Gemmatimonadaceae bacterium]